jgi:hypothetical protein
MSQPIEMDPATALRPRVVEEHGRRGGQYSRVTRQPSPARALLIHLIQLVHFRWLSGAGTLFFRKIRKRQ